MKILSLPLVALLVSACASSGVDRSDALTSRLDDVSASAATATTAVDRVSGTLSALVDCGGGAECRVLFDRFHEELGHVRAANSAVDSATDSMHAAVDAHFAAWEQDANSMQNAAIRDAALRRRDEARTRTSTLDPVASKVATSFDAYVADLSDIEKLLAVDLSPGGVSAATRSVRNVSTEASQVKAALKELESTVSEVRETLAVKQASAPAAVSAR